jgi:hypothetical protein
MEALSWCSLPIRRAATIAFPWQPGAGKSGAALALRWSFHVLFWTGVLAGLWYLNGAGGMERNLRSAWPVLHRVWLPLLGVLVYAIAWLGAGLWSALGRPPATAAWPDIDDAWRDARQALERAEIDAVRTPLFLILGPWPRELQAPLESLGASSLPLRATAPLRVFANRDAVYVVCERLARFAQEESTDAETFRTDRLRHLCELLLRERAPALPIQGIVVIAPTDAPAQRLLQACQDDLRDVRKATGLEVPLYLAVAGTAPLANVGAGARWLQRFPPQPDLDPAEIITMYRRGVDNLCLTQLPLEAYTHLRPEPEALAENLRTYQWLHSVHARRGWLEKMLAEGMLSDASEPGLVAGCYFLPTGLAEPQAVGLVRTLCADLQAHRRTARWTAETLARVEEERRRIRLGYAFGSLGLLLAIALVAGALVWRP